MSERDQWDSSISFIFAMIGAAVGLGNIWRFSYVLYSNGGGSFFIPYFTAIALMGVPFLILEYGVGFSFKESFSKIMRKINPKFEIIAWILVIFVFVVTIYYMVILSWDLVYLLSSFTFSWGTDAALYFTKTVGGSSNLANAGFLLIPTTIGVLILWVILWFIAHRNVDKGIGKVSKILIPALFIIMGIIVIYALTLLWSRHRHQYAAHPELGYASGCKHLAGGIRSNYLFTQYGSGNCTHICQLSS